MLLGVNFCTSAELFPADTTTFIPLFVASLIILVKICDWADALAFIEILITLAPLSIAFFIPIYVFKIVAFPSEFAIFIGINLTFWFELFATKVAISVPCPLSSIIEFSCPEEDKFSFKSTILFLNISFSALIPVSNIATFTSVVDFFEFKYFFSSVSVLFVLSLFIFSVLLSSIAIIESISTEIILVLLLKSWYAFLHSSSVS